MRIEELINFSQLSFVDGKSIYQYSLVGENQQHSCLPVTQGVFEYRSDEITPVGSPAIWHELLKGSLDLPQTCSVCSQNSQVFLWRTFTDRSLESFKNNKGRGKILDLEICDHLDVKGRLVHIKKREELEEPGYLWVARSADLAMAVGLSRAIFSDEPVSLLGINVCKCDLEASYHLYTTISSHGETYIWSIDPVDLDRVDKHNFFKDEELVTEIPQHKIESGIVYRIDSTFFDYIKKALEGVSLSEINLRRLASFLDKVLIDIARQDPNMKNITDPLDLNVLARTWRPFLGRIPNITFTNQVRQIYHGRGINV